MNRVYQLNERCTSYPSRAFHLLLCGEKKLNKSENHTHKSNNSQRRNASFRNSLEIHQICKICQWVTTPSRSLGSFLYWSTHPLGLILLFRETYKAWRKWQPPCHVFPHTHMVLPLLIPVSIKDCLRKYDTVKISAICLLMKWERQRWVLIQLTSKNRHILPNSLFHPNL